LHPAQDLFQPLLGKPAFRKGVNFVHRHVVQERADHHVGFLFGRRRDPAGEAAVIPILGFAKGI